MDNVASPDLPTLSEADAAYAERFFENLLDCLSVLGITFFNKATERSTNAQVFRLTGKGATAEGFESKNGFIVKKGSTATKQLTPTFRTYQGAVDRREQLIKSGVLVDAGDVLRFSQNYEFDNPSAAAWLVYGNPINGRTARRTKANVTLREIQEKCLAESAR